MSSQAARKGHGLLAPPQLPKGFLSIENILDNCSDRIGNFVNVVGIISDCRGAVPTKGKDYKMTLSLYDLSTEGQGRSLEVCIFRQQAQMPNVNAGDVFLGLQLKIQEHGGISLITNYASILHVYAGPLIPQPVDSQSAVVALKTNPARRQRQPSDQEHRYVSYFYSSIDKCSLPSHELFQEEMRHSLNVTDKFSTLDKAVDGNFYMVVVEVVKNPFGIDNLTTLWVSDYTTNSQFFCHGGATADGGVNTRDGDPYGYTAKFKAEPKSSTTWTGPPGQMSMQVTCWDPHAGYIQDNEICVGTWLCLRNLQVKHGHNNNHLEGFLRQDHKYPDRIRVEILGEDSHHANPWLKEALRRKREYERSKKRKLPGEETPRDDDCQRKTMRTSETVAGKDRPQPAAATVETASKRRERLKTEKARAAKAQAEELAQASKIEEALRLNKLVKCEHSAKEASPISRLLEPVYYETTVNGLPLRILLPFTNVNYRVNVRVVDFRPNRLEGFAFYHDPSNQSQDLPGLDQDTDQESEQVSSYESSQARGWQWCFSLLVEGVSAAKKPGKQSPERVWVVVDNFGAQGLCLDDAVDLRKNPEALMTLRNKMSILWGNLEEIKKAKEENSGALKRGKKSKGLAMPPLSSEASAPAAAETGEPLRNKPFSCCIRQYGVQRRTDDPSEADAGRGMKWMRVFGLFGTKICA